MDAAQWGEFISCCSKQGQAAKTFRKGNETRPTAGGACVPPRAPTWRVCLLQLDYGIHRIGGEKATSKLAKVTLEKSLVVNAFGAPFRYGRKLLRAKKILLSSSVSLKHSHSLVSTGIGENTRILKSWDSHLFYEMGSYLHIPYRNCLRNCLMCSKLPHIIPKQKMI